MSTRPTVPDPSPSSEPPGPTPGAATMGPPVAPTADGGGPPTAPPVAPTSDPGDTVTDPLAPPTAGPDVEPLPAITDPSGAGPDRICPTCGRRAGPDDRFCEADGTALDRPGSPLTVCACGVGKGTDGGDGFCATCGMRLLAAAGPGEHGDAMAPA